MRIHTDLLQPGDLSYALATVNPWLKLELTQHGSRSRSCAYEVGIEYFGEKVKGDGRHRRNYGTSGGGFDMPYAATWDEWGEWLAALYDLDPDMKAGPYENYEDFLRQTRQAKSWAMRGKAKARWLDY